MSSKSPLVKAQGCGKAAKIVRPIRNKVLVRVGQCAKSLKCSNFQAFSNAFGPNVYKNAKRYKIF